MTCADPHTVVPHSLFCSVFVASEVLSDFCSVFVASEVLSDFCSMFVASEVLSDFSSVFVASEVLSDFSSVFVASEVLSDFSSVLVPHNLFCRVQPSDHIWRGHTCGKVPRCRVRLLLYPSVPSELDVKLESSPPSSSPSSSAGASDDTVSVTVKHKHTQNVRW